MPVNLPLPNPADLHPVAGVQLGVASAGIRKGGRRDVLVVALAQGSAVLVCLLEMHFVRRPSRSASPIWPQALRAARALG